MKLFALALSLFCATTFAQTSGTIKTNQIDWKSSITIDNSKVLNIDSMKPPSILLYGGSPSSVAILTIAGDGTILVYGKRPQSDKEIADAIRDFARKSLRPGGKAPAPN